MPDNIAEKKQLPTIGEYEIVRKIGEGGLAEIFLGRQQSLNRLVAIKILHRKITRNKEIVKRFERESVTLARMSHPNIVHVIDRGKDNGRLYFAMQYVEGTDFKAVLKEKSWKLKEKLDVIIQVLKGLDYAHKNGVIHRDIKPANILIDNMNHALIADFGIAQLLREESDDHTQTGTVMGTYAYMSPEQKEDSTRVDHRTDIYSVGVMLYEVLIGRRPMGRFKLPSELRTELPKGYDEIVIKAMAQSADERYDKAVEMKDELLAALHAGDKYRSSTPEHQGKVKNFVGNCSFLDTLRDSEFGSTYLVEEQSKRLLYVIKKQNKPEIGQREAKLLSNLSHPNILTVHGAGGDDSKLVIIMDYAQSGSLAERLLKPLPWREAIPLMMQIASGMDFAHKNNIIHGNIKPSNILFDSEEIIKLVDFSLIPSDDGKTLIQYTSPEGRRSKLADIYSVGVVYYQLLTNRLPCRDDAAELIWEEVEGSIPKDLKSLIEETLKQEPSERISSFAEVHRQLSSVDDSEPEEVVVDHTNTHVARRNLMIWGGLFVLCLTALILYIAGTFD